MAKAAGVVLQHLHIVTMPTFYPCHTYKNVNKFYFRDKKGDKDEGGKGRRTKEGKKGGKEVASQQQREMTVRSD